MPLRWCFDLTSNNLGDIAHDQNVWACAWSHTHNTVFSGPTQRNCHDLMQLSSTPLSNFFGLNLVRYANKIWLDDFNHLAKDVKHLGIIIPNKDCNSKNKTITSYGDASPMLRVPYSIQWTSIDKPHPHTHIYPCLSIQYPCLSVSPFQSISLECYSSKEVV